MAQRPVVVLATHPHEGHYACGGAIHRFLEAGTEVHLALFHTGKSGPPPGAPEASAAQRVQTRVYGYDTCNLPAVRQPLLEDLVRLQRELRPGTVFLPSRNDLHQDHQTVHMEGLRAFKMGTILGYELPCTSISCDYRHFIVLEARHVQAKVEALRADPPGSSVPPVREDDVWSQARSRGVQIGAEYAETFDVLRWVRH